MAYYIIPTNGETQRGYTNMCLGGLCKIEKLKRGKKTHDDKLNLCAYILTFTHPW